MNYILKYKDADVLYFNTKSGTLSIVNKSLLPMSIAGMKESYDMIRKFCSDRILMMNREYCKEILNSCNIDDQSDISICITGKALSFRDNYWICSQGSYDTWESVNLYKNNFSTEIEYISLTGDLSKYVISDDLSTGELTNKGTKAKCFHRENGMLFLIKHESLTEIKAEILTYYLADALGLRCSQYSYNRFNNLDCSVCRIFTSEEYELIPCRDIMSYYGETSLSFNSKTFNTFMSVGNYDFLKMLLLDYIVLNTDRNRDNYGILKHSWALTGLYPIFDHDSCFKGKLESAIYFPTGVSFSKSLSYIKENYKQYLYYIRPNLNNLKSSLLSDNFKDLFKLYSDMDTYNSVLRRLNNILA